MPYSTPRPDRHERDSVVGLPLESVIYGPATPDYVKVVDMVAQDPTTPRVCERVPSDDKAKVRAANRHAQAALGYAKADYPDLPWRMRRRTVEDEEGVPWLHIFADARPPKGDDR